MTSQCDVTNSVYPVTMTTIRHCSILEFGRGASNQAVAPGITRPLHATVFNHNVINLYFTANKSTMHKSYYDTWAQFCCKMGGSLLCNQYSHRVDAKVTFSIYRSPILFLEVFCEQHSSRFVLADDLHINILKFVAGHGAAVKPATINIVFGCKQAQQYSRTHHLGLSELSVGLHKMLNGSSRTCISLLH